VPSAARLQVVPQVAAVLLSAVAMLNYIIVLGAATSPAVYCTAMSCPSPVAHRTYVCLSIGCLLVAAWRLDLELHEPCGKSASYPMQMQTHKTACPWLVSHPLLVCLHC